MLSPISTAVSPPHGWSVTIEGAGPEIRDYNFSAFIVMVSTRLQDNGLDKHGWRAWVIDLMCRQRPDIQSEDLDAPDHRSMTGDDVKRFLTTMWAIFEKGTEPVDFETQNRRVDICSACPKLGYISCFIGCSQITDVVNKFMAGRDVPKFPQIHKMACLACGCTASVKSMWPVAMLREVDAAMGVQPDYHPKCWMLTEVQPSSAQPPPD